MSLTILILAAGASSRMRGADKLLEDVGGQPCLRHVARRALQVSDDVLVTLPFADHPRADALGGLALRLLAVPDASEGMAASIRAGVAAMPKHATALMIMPADMPDITGRDMAQLWAVFQVAQAKVLQAATHDMQAGHPVIFHRDLLPALAKLQGDTGARDLIKGMGRHAALLPLEGNSARCDLDTPEDWAAWRKASD